MAALSLAGLCCFEFSLPGISAHALKIKMLRAQGFFLPGRKCRGAQCNRMGWGCRGGRERKKAVLQTKVATSLDIKGQEGAQGLQSYSERGTQKPVLLARGQDRGRSHSAGRWVTLELSPAREPWTPGFLLSLGISQESRGRVLVLCWCEDISGGPSGPVLSLSIKLQPRDMFGDRTNS